MKKNTKNGEVLVAVYGTLMQGEANERWRAGIPTIAETTVRGTLYDTQHGYPAFVPSGMGTKSSRVCDVRMEVLSTDEAGLAHMDVLEGYPNLYRRERIGVDVNGEEREAWVYVMNRLPRSARVIECGDWRIHNKWVRDALAGKF